MSSYTQSELTPYFFHSFFECLVRHNIAFVTMLKDDRKLKLTIFYLYWFRIVDHVYFSGQHFNVPLFIVRCVMCDGQVIKHTLCCIQNGSISWYWLCTIEMGSMQTYFQRPMQVWKETSNFVSKYMS